jgi:murein DD-endopeptidase MepM/ murein hydrolase activator NlpD
VALLVPAALLLGACAGPAVERRARYVGSGDADSARPVGVGGPDEGALGEIRSVSRGELEDCPELSIPERTVRRLAGLPEAAPEPAMEEFPAAALAESFQLPLADPEVSSPFGVRRDPFQRRRQRMHRGVDFVAEAGTPVYATASGRALMAGWCDRGTGNCVVLQHPNAWRSQYFHLSEVYIRAGQWVEQGTHLGDVGSTGRSTGPHLHFQLGRDGHAVDPMTLVGTPLDP